MSKSILQRRAEIQGLATAILLPSVGLFGGSTGPHVGGVGPLTNVVGIGLFQRAVLTLQRAGIRQLDRPVRIRGGTAETGARQRASGDDSGPVDADS